MLDNRGMGRKNLWKFVEEEFNFHSKRKASLRQLQDRWRELRDAQPVFLFSKKV